jgi:ADP-ribose pyrophosphatase YjhB (NUDIX family)
MKRTDRGRYENPNVMVDVVLFTIAEGRLHVALARRTNPDEPFAGRKALVGGFIHVDEDRDADATAARILRAKAGLTDVYIEQLQTFSGRKRDPRGWSVSIAYMALVPLARFREAGREEVTLRPAEDVSGLPFDHDEILATALRRLRGKGAYSTLPARLLDSTFTLAAMQQVYEQDMGTALDTSSFRRKVAELDIIEDTGEMESGERRRPGRLFRLKGNVTTFNRKI